MMAKTRLKHRTIPKVRSELKSVKKHRQLGFQALEYFAHIPRNLQVLAIRVELLMSRC